MTNGITIKGRLLAGDLAQYIGVNGHIARTCSLIARHATTLENVAVRQCNDANADQDKLDKRWDQLTARIDGLVYDLPESDGGHIVAEFQGDPRGCIVKLIVIDGHGIPRTFGVNS